MGRFRAAIAAYSDSSSAIVCGAGSKDRYLSDYDAIFVRSQPTVLSPKTAWEISVDVIDPDPNLSKIGKNPQPNAGLSASCRFIIFRELQKLLWPISG